VRWIVILTSKKERHYHHANRNRHDHRGENWMERYTDSSHRPNSKRHDSHEEAGSAKPINLQVWQIRPQLRFKEAYFRL